jgi:hypothetical protein
MQNREELTKIAQQESKNISQKEDKISILVGGRNKYRFRTKIWTPVATPISRGGANAIWE